MFTSSEKENIRVNYGRGEKACNLTQGAIVAVNGAYVEKAGYTAMSRGACIKGAYSKADRVETARKLALPVVVDGDVIKIDGIDHTAHVAKFSASDQAYFLPTVEQGA